LFDQFEHRVSSYKAYLFWGLFGAIAPDTDYLFLFLFDSLNPDHHLYLTHYPYFWLTLLLISVLWLNVNKQSQNPVFALLFSLGGFNHMILDTIPSKIFWGAPFTYKPFGVEMLLQTYAPSIIENPDWGYAVEFLIILLAIYLFLEHNRRALLLRCSND
jgi:inner membrane protein